jgi:Family of unknown function (DUF5678)
MLWKSFSQRFSALAYYFVRILRFPQYLLHQQHLYQAAKPELLGQYEGQYIAFENGNILDSDRDDRQLMPRLYAKYGHRDILVEYVCDPEPQLSVSAAGHLFPSK